MIQPTLNQTHLKLWHFLTKLLVSIICLPVSVVLGSDTSMPEDPLPDVEMRSTPPLNHQNNDIKIHIVEIQMKSSALKTTMSVFHDLPTWTPQKTHGDPSEHALILKLQSWSLPHTWTKTWTKTKPQTFSSFFTKLQLTQNVSPLQIRWNSTKHGRVHGAFMHLEWALTFAFPAYKLL